MIYKNPNIKKCKTSGEFLYARFKYMKFEQIFTSAEEVASLLGYNTRGALYLIFNNEQPVDLREIELYSDVFQLTKKEEEIFCLMVCHDKAKSDFEKKVFKKLLREAKRT